MKQEEERLSKLQVSMLAVVNRIKEKEEATHKGEAEVHALLAMTHPTCPPLAELNKPTDGPSYLTMTAEQKLGTLEKREKAVQAKETTLQASLVAIEKVGHRR